MFTLFLGIVAFSSLLAPVPSLCSVGALRHNPEGYFWPLPDVRGFVDSAEVIVRARAVRDQPRNVPPPLFNYPDTQVQFEILEVLKGGPVPSAIPVAGKFVDRDDFNRSPVPFRMVRPSGQRGDCYASEYKLNAEYLMLLRRRSGVLTPYWAPLAPLNEQIHGKDDPWVQWVRSEIDAR